MKHNQHGARLLNLLKPYSWAPASNLKWGAKKNLKNVAHHGWATKKILAFQML